MPPRINDGWLWLGLGVATYLAIKGSAYAISRLVLLGDRSQPLPQDTSAINDTTSPKEPPRLYAAASRISSQSLATLAGSPNPNIARTATHIFLRRFLGSEKALETLFYHLNDPQFDGPTPERLAAERARALICGHGYGYKLPKGKKFGKYDYRPLDAQGNVIVEHEEPPTTDTHEQPDHGSLGAAGRTIPLFITDPFVSVLRESLATIDDAQASAVNVQETMGSLTEAERYAMLGAMIFLGSEIPERDMQRVLIAVRSGRLPEPPQNVTVSVVMRRERTGAEARPEEVERRRRRREAVAVREGGDEGPWSQSDIFERAGTG